MQSTRAERFFTDPRVARARQLILEALSEHQTSLTGIQYPDSELRHAYEDRIETFGELRGGGLFYPYLGSGIGRGPLVELADGSVKYDFISGIGVHHWGHSHPDMIAAALDAAIRDVIVQGNLQQNEESLALAEELLAAANAKAANLKHCFFSTSGAMANENALKVMFQKNSPADRLLAFEHCFAGRTLAMASVTDKPDYREGIPSTLSVDYVPFFDPNRPEESVRRSLDHVICHLGRYPGKHAAMIFELVQGEGGFHPGSPEFFVALMKLLRSHGVAVMVDEVQTFGRTTELFAFQHFGLDEFVDVVTVGKCSHVCATLFKAEYKPRPGLLSQTFTAGTAAIFAARTLLRGLTQGGYFGPDGKIARLHDHFERRLKEISERMPGVVEGPFGIGAMVAFTPFGGDSHKVKRFVHALFEAGVISFYCGANPTRVRFLVPVGAATFEDIDTVVAIVEKTLAAMTF
jgi:4-aminobutyrate aminotransferase-like enzyme